MKKGCLECALMCSCGKNPKDNGASCKKFINSTARITVVIPPRQQGKFWWLHLKENED